MTQRIRVYIGRGASFDGGPFVNAEVVDNDETTFTFKDGSGAHTVEHAFMYEIIDEMRENEPVRLTSVSKSQSFKSMSVPILSGFLYESNGLLCSGEELRASPDLRRRMSTSFRYHGGTIRPN